MLGEAKVYFQGVWGSVKKSKSFNVLVALMAILPLVDICTDYAFLITTLSKRNIKNLERIIAWITVAVLYLSSRLVLWMRFLYTDSNIVGRISEEYRAVTIKNISIYYFPFVDLCVLLYMRYDEFIEDDWDICVYMLLAFTYFLFLLTAPFVHFGYVAYCVYRQMKEHLIEKRDYPAFGPLSFLEITESLPQFIMQSLLFWLGDNNLNGTWGSREWLYVLSSVASIVAMIKAVWAYYMRYAIIKKGFVADAIDDVAYLIELMESNGNEKEMIKVVSRMKAQNTINDVNTYGETSLVLASRKGKDKIVELLLKNGANVDALNKYGETSLEVALRKSYDTIVKLLVKNGANIDDVNMDEILLEKWSKY